MKPLTFIALFLLLLFFLTPAKAGLYVDFGTGWINEITIEQTFGGIENRLSLPVDSWFILLRGGYETNGWYFELETIGTPERTFDTFKIYRRFTF